MLIIKKHGLEVLMGCLLILSFYFLSVIAANRGGELTETSEAGTGVILVDAGHGGSDPGMIGVNDLEEKGINLSISLKLRDILQNQGFTVVMTREEDTGLYEESARNKKAQDLQNRIALIQEEEPLLSVSIHQNSYTDPEVRGPQVFYYQDSAEGERLAQILQESLNTELEIEKPRTAKGEYYILSSEKKPRCAQYC